MSKIVFVVGAGASNEFGLPTGERLKDEIAATLHLTEDYSVRFRDHHFHNLIRPYFTDNRVAEKHLRAAKLISANMARAPSIDNFVDTHRDNAEVARVAKLAIAQCIVRAEASSSLFVNQENIYNSLNAASIKETWLAQLFRALVAQRDFSAFLDVLRRMYFISFNYDRCIHQFFYFSAKEYFSLSDQSALDVMGCLNVVYPYGSIGPLKYDDAVRTGFGVLNENKLRNAADFGLRTFTEGGESNFTESASSIMEGADRVFFLGFGFLPLNMQMVLGEGRFAVGGVYGTAKGLSKTAISEIRERLAFHFYRAKFQETFMDLNGKIVLEPITCSELIWEHSRFLSSV